MSYNIEIQPSGVKYPSEDNLLEDALSQSLPLEHSCKNGDCGVCTASVISGSVVNENGETVTSGEILTCKSRAISDVVLNAKYYPELACIKKQTLPCKISSLKFPLKDVAVITFRFPTTARFEFLPGQYIDLNYQGIQRSYSIANSRKVEGSIELHIRRVNEGRMSEFIFGDLKINQLMRIEGPKGTFFVRNGKKPLIFLGTGTGIAPILSMVEQLLDDGDKREINIYWGMRNSEEFYCERLVELSEKYNNVHYNPVASRELDWGGHTGYVQDAVLQDFKSLADVEIYACGSVKMIESSKELFFKNELSLEAFHSDAFTPSKHSS
ncbi:FAD-binding oxidoreductase [Enterovibrio norvegicus]|uniref:FAD-binding oxidoreductase n=1 Tax=Enterovibrio norvegicus TaxID=188144 RepID=A0ABV4KWA8_9GAMM|nr:FAD-binding oxidoreductase [Enterovibrio norvegicus]OEF58815.1 CDP-6-deoxy-delta-3,4-glucoseen reductase [Enterovibrio norvegicus]